jgi:hypothetical protein
MVPFAQDEGYTPLTIEELMDLVMDGVNDEFGTTYTTETFIGTNLYKYFYALMQLLQESEVKTSEIFLKLTQYFAITNEDINRPAVVPQGTIERLNDAGYEASVKPMIEADAGEVNICVDKLVEGEDYWEDTDDYADDKLEVATIIKSCVAAGIVSLGSESESIVLTNGQSFDYKYHLPDRTEILLRLTTTLSENNQVVIDSPDDVKQRLLDNVLERYKLGKNFEPQKYFNIADDAPWAGELLLEWSDDAGANWYSDIFDADFDEFFVVLLENISLVEA